MKTVRPSRKLCHILLRFYNWCFFDRL